MTKSDVKKMAEELLLAIDEYQDGMMNEAYFISLVKIIVEEVS